MDPWRTVCRAVLRKREDSWWFALVFAAGFAVVQTIGHFHHEMWRDELHCWAVGRNATGLWDLLTGERRYDGHPFLWYYLLHLASRVTRHYAALQVVSASLAVAAAGLWLRYAVVPRVLRVALLGSYYVLFEYGIMCRGYSLGLLLTFAFCTLYQPYRIRYFALGVTLALLTATSLYGMLVSIALAGFLFSHGPILEAPDAADSRRRLALPLDWASGLAVFVLGLVVTLVSSWPPADALYGPTAVVEVTPAALREGLARYWQAMFPFNRWLDWLWPEPSSLGRRLVVPAAIEPWLGAACLACWCVAFRRAPRVMICYGLGVLLIAAGQHFVYVGGLRHLGHYFILTVACLWLHANETRGRARERLIYALFAVGVAVQMVTGAVAFRKDLAETFSGSLEAATFIRAHHLERHTVVADADAPVAPVAVILDHPFFFPVTGETAETTVFHVRRTSVSQAQLLEHAARLARASGGVSLILTTYDLVPVAKSDLVVTLLHRGAPSIIPDESLRIYEAKVH